MPYLPRNSLLHILTCIHILFKLSTSFTIKYDGLSTYYFSYKIASEPSSQNSPNYYRHVPVMLKEVMDYLITSPKGMYLDVTLGYGGHTEELLHRLHQKGNVVGIDRDYESIYYTSERLRNYIECSRLLLTVGRFGDLIHVLRSKDLPTSNYSGILADLGMSTHQLEKSERGFSYIKDGPLDMRMTNPACDPYTNNQIPLLPSSNSAYSLINQSDEVKLSKIFKEYGEEPKGPTIAKKIIEVRRKKGKINTTDELKRIVISALPINHKNKMKVLSRIFQAIRIYINDELKELEMLLSTVPDLLKVNGRMVILSYHSLEDRTIKRAFKDLKQKNMEYSTYTFNILTKKCVTPSNEEIESNIRSAKLRCIEKIKYSKSC